MRMGMRRYGKLDWGIGNEDMNKLNSNYYNPVNGLSDGFIKAPSQIGYNSAWSNNATKIEALGVNHQEMRDHVVVRDIFERIFNGTIPGQSQYFFTPIR
jgi:hypothetical protein